jgi:hypothetical protein
MLQTYLAFLKMFFLSFYNELVNFVFTLILGFLLSGSYKIRLSLMFERS